MGLTTIRGVLLATNYRLIFTAYREESEKKTIEQGEQESEDRRESMTENNSASGSSSSR